MYYLLYLITLKHCIPDYFPMKKMVVLKNYIITAVFMPAAHRECDVANIQRKFCKTVAAIKKNPI